MTDLDLDGLAALAQAATSNPGYAFGEGGNAAKFRAAISPSTITSLVQLLKRAEEAGGLKASVALEYMAECDDAEARAVDADASATYYAKEAKYANRERLRAEAEADRLREERDEIESLSNRLITHGEDCRCYICIPVHNLRALLCSPTADTEGSDRADAAE